jgi:hypothetical protein
VRKSAKDKAPRAGVNAAFCFAAKSRVAPASRLVEKDRERECANEVSGRSQEPRSTPSARK